jgi:prepilin-type N-terminal cleavage/methylation domain-containing protein
MEGIDTGDGSGSSDTRMTQPMTQRRSTPWRGLSRRTPGRASGFSLIEMMVVTGIVAVGASFSVVQTEQAFAHYRANAAMRAIEAQLTLARNLAITQRRNMVVQCLAPNQVQVTRQEVPTGSTVLSTTTLGYGAIIQRFTSVTDTPDAFGINADCDFGATTTTASFTPEGAFVSQLGLPINGTVYLGIPTDAKTIRAVTVFGTTGRIRGYRWTWHGKTAGSWGNP